MRGTKLLFLMSICSTVAVADENCQSLLNKLTSKGRRGPGKVSSAAKPVKCHAYEQVALELVETANACGTSQKDVDFAKLKIPPFARRVADGEQQYCGR